MANELRERHTWLVQVRGPGRGTHVLLGEGQVLTVGRGADCDLLVPEQDVSRRHARLETRGGRTLVEDLGSTNGTRVNDELLRAPRELRDGDLVDVAGAVFRFLHDCTLWEAMRETR